jgi:hypothetical protein
VTDEQLPATLLFRQNSSAGLRGFVAVAGLICLFPTYDLLIRPGVPVLQLGMLPMWIISLGALALGLMLLAAAVLGISRTVIFDPAGGEMLELSAADFGLRWRRRHGFRDLGSPDVVRDRDSDGPPYYRVVILCAGMKRPIEIERYPDEAAARAAAQRISAVIAQHGR